MPGHQLNIVYLLVVCSPPKTCISINTRGTRIYLCFFKVRTKFSSKCDDDDDDDDNDDDDDGDEGDEEASTSVCLPYVIINTTCTTNTRVIAIYPNCY